MNNKNKSAIIVGATGATGKALTNLLINDNRYSQITLLIRKKPEIQHPKLNQLIFDFNKLSPAEFYADELYCCLGTTMKKAGSKDAFKKVDFEYVINIAKLAYQNEIKKLAVVSAIGANKKSAFFYNKVKGEMEEELSKIPFQHIVISRPSLIVGERDESRRGENFAKIFMTAFDFFIPKKYKAVKAEKIASIITNAMNNPPQNKLVNIIYPHLAE